MSTEGELWHIVEARRDDGTPTMFRIRELDPVKSLDKIFVVELPYPVTGLSRLPEAAAYRRLSDFDDQWLRPACTRLGWELVGSKTEDGSFFLYMYGSGDPQELIAALSPFDAGLGFYDDVDPDWLEYATLRELLEQAKAIPQTAADAPAEPPKAKTQPLKKGARAARPAKAAAKAAAKPAKAAVKPAKAAVKPAKAAKAAAKAAKATAKAAAKPAKATKATAKAAAKPAKATTKPVAKAPAKAAKAAAKSVAKRPRRP